MLLHDGLAFAACLLLGFPSPLRAQPPPPTCSTTGIAGVLRVSTVNPRYFTNDCGKAIYLTGSHTWNNFPDMDDEYPPDNQPFDYAHYLDFLDQYNHNFIRLWAWEGPFPDNANLYARRVWAGAQPWLRTGPGNDVTGHLKFDLTQWNQAYFDRLRTRVSQAQARGKYVSIMLFEGWELQFAPGANSHPFDGPNNINGIDVSTLTDIHTLHLPEITSIQEEYVRRVIDSVNDLDNVLYEIANEPGGSYSTPFETHFIQFVKQYEAGKPKQHPVGMTFQYPDGNNSTLFSSAADWISPGLDGSASYDNDPPASTGSKVIVNDTDHLGGSSAGDRGWVWKSFCRGLNTLFMDRYDLPWSITNGPIANGIDIRRAMGNTLTYSQRMDLLHATPSTTIASTGYALVTGSELLVYSPSSSSFSVDLGGYSGLLQAEWFNPGTQQTTQGGEVTAGVTTTFLAPFSGDAVLFLNRPGATDTPGDQTPLAFALDEPVPNPTSSGTRIGYDLPVEAPVRIGVYDVSGRIVALLVDGVVPAGRREANWDGTGVDGRRVSGGVWFVRMTASGHTVSRRVLLIR